MPACLCLPACLPASACLPACLPACLLPRWPTGAHQGRLPDGPLPPAHCAQAVCKRSGRTLALKIYQSSMLTALTAHHVMREVRADRERVCVTEKLGTADLDRLFLVIN
jgi:hypothetical protein